jgi:hypothetical protein
MHRTLGDTAYGPQLPFGMTSDNWGNLTAETQAATMLLPGAGVFTTPSASPTGTGLNAETLMILGFGALLLFGLMIAAQGGK